jgi:branched-chain amino acid transport system ATP-binding protein
MTALENVLVGMHCRLRGGILGSIVRTPRVRREEREAQLTARELLRFSGLRGRDGEMARNLPYGDQRRLEIARALALEPKVLLLDEPAAGMNPSETQELMTDILRIHALGITILLIEHDMKLVRGICSRVVALDHGSKIAEGTFEQVQSHPAVLEAYLGKRAAAGA